MHENAFSLVSMFVAAFFIDQRLKAPRLRKWLGVAVFMGGLSSLFYIHLETFCGIDLMLCKIFAMIMGMCLFWRRDQHMK
ncbi:hypothetical protein [Pseudomonas guariconensis]|uniref:hypothetical protein n=1 Tax=Pseudomonas guariconensis TaxID=1288410 RepID=UPI0034664A49